MLGSGRSDRGKEAAFRKPRCRLVAAGSSRRAKRQSTARGGLGSRNVATVRGQGEQRRPVRVRANKSSGFVSHFEDFSRVASRAGSAAAARRHRRIVRYVLLLAQAAAAITPTATGAAARGSSATANSRPTRKPPGPSVSAAAPTSVFEELMKSGTMGYINDSGLFMWPIMFLALLAFGVIKRHGTLKMLSTDTDNFAATCSISCNAIGPRKHPTFPESQGPRGGLSRHRFAELRRAAATEIRSGEDPRAGREGNGRLRRARHRWRWKPSANLSHRLQRGPDHGFLGTVQGMVTSLPRNHCAARQGRHRAGGSASPVSSVFRRSRRSTISAA